MSTGSGIINSGMGVPGQAGTLEPVLGVPTLDTATAPNKPGSEYLQLDQLEQPSAQHYQGCVECHEVTLRGLWSRCCVIGSKSLADLFGCDDVTVVNQDGQYQIRAAGREFLLKDDGTLLGSIRSKAQTSDVDANTVEYQALARVLLVSGKVLFVPPRLSAKAAYQCPPSSLAFDAVINRAQWGITKMTHAVMDILGIKHAAADRTLVGECSVDTSAVAITVELGPSEQTVTREPSPYTMRFRLYSDGILEIKETRDWFFHPCRAGDPVKGFVWHETREWIIPL